MSGRDIRRPGAGVRVPNAEKASMVARLTAAAGALDAGRVLVSTIHFSSEVLLIGLDDLYHQEPSR